ncbi:hypothetical protein ACTWJ8_39795 (plasmid) [Streptomyces sp. SDT5-1]|uniref:hypothetical protein n=1 Tax=Streptomyces sp. SDT5-1 TaxID=3406418 RepID=UPI003FD6126F
MFEVMTPSGRVAVAPAEPDASGAVLYELTGSVRGSVHVTVAHNPRQWDRFDTVRVSLGSADATLEEPAGPLPRVRGRDYTGRLLHGPADGAPADSLAPSVTGPTGNPAPPQAAETLTQLMRAAGDDFRARSDLADLRERARRHTSPRLIGWLRAMIQHKEQAVARCAAQAVEDRRAARFFTAYWWSAARLLIEHQAPVVLVLLADGPDTAARRAVQGEQLARISDEVGRDEDVLADRFRSELAGLTSARPEG